MAENKDKKVLNVPNKRELTPNTFDSVEHKEVRLKRNVPNLRFKEFEGEWKENKLKNICTFYSGGTPTSSNNKYYGGNIPFIRSGELHKAKTELMITEEGYNNSSAKMVEKGDLLLAMYGATSGDIAISRIKGAINQAILCIKTNHNKKFLEAIWSKHVNRILKTYLQGGQGNLSADVVKQITFSIPTIQEQEKLAQLFFILDERIATQNKIIDKLESLIKGISRKLLDEEEGHYVSLENILKERIEKTTINNQYEVLSSTVNGIFIQREYFSREIASSNNVGYKVLRLNEIVLSPQNLWMGNINYNKSFKIGIVSPSYKIFSIADCYDKDFIAALLKTNRALYNYALASEQGASIVRRNLNIEAFKQIVFKLPSYKKQCQIGKTISLLEKSLENNMKLKNSYELQKTYLLRQMFI